jgi:hypothetical protein
VLRKGKEDNGSEFIGCFRQDRTRDGFEKVVEGFGCIHKRIPVRCWSYNSDVETVHSTIESEFYDLENFESIKDFHQRVASYQAWYNLVRENSNKGYKTPLQIITDVSDKIVPAVARLPPLMLDWLGPDYITKEELYQRGYDVPFYPYRDDQPQKTGATYRNKIPMRYSASPIEVAAASFSADPVLRIHTSHMPVYELRTKSSRR